MIYRLAAVTVVVAIVLSMAACGPSRETQKNETETPSVDTPTESPADDAAGGTRLAPGLYDIEGGQVQAIGVLQYRDVEGGFYAVTLGDDAAAEVLVVIANEQEFRRQLEPLKGSLVDAIGIRAEGASTRMAGLEIQLESISKIEDDQGIAE